MSALAKSLKLMKYPFRVFTGKEINTKLRELKPHFDNLSDDIHIQKRLNLPAQKIMKKRRMMGYNVEFSSEGKITQLQENYQLDKPVENQNLQYQKIYEEFTPEFKNDQNFKDFLSNTLSVCWELKQIKRASIVCHAIRTVINSSFQLQIQISYQGQPAQPTPEGPHQDGVDFEVVGVVNKDNCQGAESQIFSPDKKALLFEMTLDPGEGYFIDGKNLWHSASDHIPVDQTKQGIRDLIGYLLKIEEQY